MMVQAGKIINEVRKEAEKIIAKNKELEEVIIERDKEIAYLKGKIEIMNELLY